MGVSTLGRIILVFVCANKTLNSLHKKGSLSSQTASLDVLTFNILILYRLCDSISICKGTIFFFVFTTEDTNLHKKLAK